MKRDGKVCHLSPWEADDLRQGVAIDCRKHRHVSVRTAEALTNVIGGARWCGPRHIEQVRDYEPHVRSSAGFLVMQLVPDRARRL